MDPSSLLPWQEGGGLTNAGGWARPSVVVCGCRINSAVSPCLPCLWVPGAVFTEKGLQGPLPPPAWPNSQEGMGTQTLAWWYSGSRPTSPGAAPGPTAVTQSLRRWGQTAPLSQDQRRQSSWLLPWQFRRAGSGSPGSTAKDLSPSASYGSDSPGLCGLPEQGPSLSSVSLCAQWSCSPCTASKFQI